MILETILILGIIFLAGVVYKQGLKIASLQTIITERDYSEGATTKRKEIQTEDKKEDILSKGKDLRDEMENELMAMKSIRKEHFERHIKKSNTSDKSNEMKLTNNNNEDYDGAF